MKTGPKAGRCLALLILMVAAACDRSPESLPPANPWAAEPLRLFRAGDCAKALERLDLVPIEVRNDLWYSLFVHSSFMCIARDTAGGYRSRLLETLGRAERARPEDAVVQLWLGIALTELGDSEGGRRKFAAARRLATAALQNSTNVEVRRANMHVIRELDKNRF